MANSAPVTLENLNKVYQDIRDRYDDQVEFKAQKVKSDIGLTAESTDAQYPSAKCVYEAIQSAVSGMISGSY